MRLELRRVILQRNHYFRRGRLPSLFTSAVIPASINFISSGPPKFAGFHERLAPGVTLQLILPLKSRTCRLEIARNLCFLKRSRFPGDISSLDSPIRRHFIGIAMPQMRQYRAHWASCSSFERRHQFDSIGNPPGPSSSRSQAWAISQKNTPFGPIVLPHCLRTQQLSISDRRQCSSPTVSPMATVSG